MLKTSKKIMNNTIRIPIIPFITSQLLKDNKRFLAYFNDGVDGIIRLENAISNGNSSHV